MANKVGPANSWRLIHNGTYVISLFESSGYTETNHFIFESDTEQGCKDEIVRLNLSQVPVPSTGITVISSLQFMERFSENTQLKVIAATKVDDRIKLWYDKLLAADEVNLKDPRTISGVNAMVSFGVITQAEADLAMSS